MSAVRPRQLNSLSTTHSDETPTLIFSPKKGVLRPIKTTIPGSKSRRPTTRSVPPPPTPPSKAKGKTSCRRREITTTKKLYAGPPPTIIQTRRRTSRLQSHNSFEMQSQSVKTGELIFPEGERKKKFHVSVSILVHISDEERKEKHVPSHHTTTIHNEMYRAHSEEIQVTEKESTLQDVFNAASSFLSDLDIYYSYSLYKKEDVIWEMYDSALDPVSLKATVPDETPQMLKYYLIPRMNNLDAPKSNFVFAVGSSVSDKTMSAEQALVKLKTLDKDLKITSEKIVLSIDDYVASNPRYQNIAKMFAKVAQDTNTLKPSDQEIILQTLCVLSGALFEEFRSDNAGGESLKNLVYLHVMKPTPIRALGLDVIWHTVGAGEAYVWMTKVARDVALAGYRSILVHTLLEKEKLVTRSRQAATKTGKLTCPRVLKEAEASARQLLLNNILKGKDKQLFDHTFLFDNNADSAIPRLIAYCTKEKCQTGSQPDMMRLFGISEKSWT